MNDLISRQEAIDAIYDEINKESHRPHQITLLHAKRRIENLLPAQQWIPVSERLPEEKDSMFAKFYGTNMWRNAMMRKRSDRVIVTVEYSDGERKTDVASTSDGRWVNAISIVKERVVAWMPLPEPYQEEQDGD